MWMLEADERIDEARALAGKTCDEVQSRLPGSVAARLAQQALREAERASQSVQRARRNSSAEDWGAAHERWQRSRELLLEVEARLGAASSFADDDAAKKTKAMVEAAKTRAERHDSSVRRSRSEAEDRRAYDLALVADRRSTVLGDRKSELKSTETKLEAERAALRASTTTDADRARLERSILSLELRVAEEALAVERASVSAYDGYEAAQAAARDGRMSPKFDDPHRFVVHAGTVVLNPYTIKDWQFTDSNNQNRELFVVENRSATDASFYLEMEFKSRRAWLVDAYTPNDDPPVYGDTWFSRAAKLIPRADDFEFRLGFVNLNSRTSEIAGATAVGAQDFYAEVSLGWNLLRSWKEVAELESIRPRYTFNFELYASLLTDRSVRNVFGSYMAGLSSVWAVPYNYSGDRWRNAEIVAGVFFGLHEFPAFASAPGADGPPVVRRERGQPRFTRKSAASVKVDVNLPLNETLDLMVSGRVASFLAGTEYPEPWSLRIGLVLPIGKVLEVFGVAKSPGS